MTQENLQMLKKFGPKLPNTATLFQKLETAGGVMNAGDVLLRQSLEFLVPFNGDRPAWFVSVSRRIGIRDGKRVKSIFYNRGCRIWGEEQNAISSALRQAQQSQNTDLAKALRVNAQTHARQAELDELKKELKLELLEDLRALLLELRNSGAGDVNRLHGQALHGN